MPGPDPAVARTRVAVREALAFLDRADATGGVGEAGSRALLVAVSGGADSLALAAALAFVAPRAGLHAHAVVVDHGLQDGSASVARRAAEQCRELGLDPEVVRVEVGADGSGPEAAARSARYAALERCRAACRASHVLVAHTRDDQAEQVLLGLLRGSGARSLAAMAPVSGRLVRPFLDLSRAETEAACAAQGIEPWRDPHNEDEHFARVRARRLLGELNARLGADLTGNLTRTARLLREDDAALDAWAREVALTVGHGGEAPRAGLVETTADLGVLRDLPRAVRTRVLRLLALRAGADGSALGFGHLDAVDRLVTDWHGQGPIDLPGKRQVERRQDSLAFGPRRPVE